ncbi:carbohydrate-binding protein [Labilibaculum sp. DW002]|uniref:Carbohydrate-binding protein n=1 Tax=Paralabilibaculum antarcticum TaxID=2912572 RepID=A0ABT5VTT7_9BACT|nr:carbohydrate-binding protein [Labilibaculum sp. DW002]MDE5418823.1 carbohydrate-binding protein [Labilibaculum sp. DW002]
MSTSTFKQVFATTILLCLFFLFPSVTLKAQGYLHVDGKSIVDGNGENFIIRSIGTGNWMLQEGYMMQSADVAGTQHEFRKKLEETIGETRTEEFYEAWLANHFRKIDVDSMAAWGFNSLRVAMHYKWFTPPIEEEPVQGEITWKDKGFDMIDDLLSWCEENQMYLILDLHGAPGGQGANADISDYDDTKPSLWEDDLNKDKAVALWRNLAERYGDSPWIGGYDLINEINWTFPEGNNSQIRELYGRITDTIRAVDPNHIIFIEGNSWANDFSGLTPAWDDNMAYSFHKYWNYNDANALKWITDFRDEHNRPIWLGETGENSNTWFANLVALSEDNNVGWSWWPVKKSGINNVLKVETNADYTQLIEMWKGNASMTSDEAYNAVMTFADNHRFENCTIQRDVIDALIRQPHSTETLPFKEHSTGENIFAVDYDLGRNDYAYFDVDTANYHLNTNEFKAWNIGWEYRNDGVDIEKCSDTEATNGYNVGWVEKGEWLQYTIQSQALATYRLELRTASESNANIHIEVNGKRVSDVFEVSSTGGWKAFATTSIENIILPEGEIKLRLVFDGGTLNVNYFTLIETGSVSEVPFELLKASSEKIDNEIYLDFNKSVTSQENEINSNEFELKVDGTNIDISDLYLNEENNQQIILITNENLFYNHNITISYNGNSIKSDEQELENFSDVSVKNNFYRHYEVPGKIQAENFITNKGFEIENCTDAGGGENTAYASDGDYLEYLLFVPEAGTFNMEFRVATEKSAKIQVMNSEDGEMVNNESISFGSTNGWQSWQTKSISVDLPQGKTVLRLVSESGEHNLNWIAFGIPTGIGDDILNMKMKVYPNPTSDLLKIDFEGFSQKEIKLFNMRGAQVVSESVSSQSTSIDVKPFPSGTYLLNVSSDESNQTIKVMIVR